MRPTAAYLVRNFTPHELRQRARHGQPETPVPARFIVNADVLRILLQRIRDLTSAHLRRRTPISILSGYRTEAYNEAITGADGSRHLRAMAADIRPRGLSIPVFHELIRRWYRLGLLPELGGLAPYPASKPPFVHVDVDRSAGRLRTWRGRRVRS